MGRVGWASSAVVLVWASLAAFVVFAADEKRNLGGKPTKGAEPASKPATPRAQGVIEMIDTVDYVRSGALIVAFLAVNFAGRDTWMLAEFISGLSFGVACFFFPDPMLGYQTDGKLDALHLYSTQVYGALLVGLAVTVYASRESRDRSVAGSILMSRILGGLVLLQAMFADNLKAKGDKQRWNDKHLSFGALGVGLWVLGALYQYLRGPSYGSSGIDLKDRITKHLLLDLLFTMPFGLFTFAFPDAILSFFTMKGLVPDGIHAHLIRHGGALLFIAALHCHSAMGFSDDIDKRAYIVGKLVTLLLVMPTASLYQYKYTLVPNVLFINYMCFHVVVIGNLLGAYFIRRKSKTY